MFSSIPYNLQLPMFKTKGFFNFKPSVSQEPPCLIETMGKVIWGVWNRTPFFTGRYSILPKSPGRKALLIGMPRALMRLKTALTLILIDQYLG